MVQGPETKCSLIINSSCTSAADGKNKVFTRAEAGMLPAGQGRCLSCVNNSTDQQLQPIASGEGKTIVSVCVQGRSNWNCLFIVYLCAPVYALNKFPEFL